MKVCLTGASSFTGYWIARELAESGHHVIATFSGSAQSYADSRRDRVADLNQRIDCRFGYSFGSEAFLAMVRQEAPDVLGLHGAEVTGYRSWEFDPLEAAKRNTQGVRPLFEALAGHGGRVVATGSVFEPYEGVGDPDRRSFNPYGLSKCISYEIYRMEAQRAGVALAKFVIPNPFGVLEERRFTYYLVSEWAASRVPRVATPDYVRDNIHVDLLAMAYAALIAQGWSGTGEVMRPAGYIESQGQFAGRFARELGSRWGRDLPVDLALQTEFSEPRIRVNDMPACQIVPDWAEPGAWDAIARFYEPVLRAAG